MSVQVSVFNCFWYYKFKYDESIKMAFASLSCFHLKIERSYSWKVENGFAIFRHFDFNNPSDLRNNMDSKVNNVH